MVGRWHFPPHWFERPRVAPGLWRGVIIAAPFALACWALIIWGGHALLTALGVL